MSREQAKSPVERKTQNDVEDKNNVQVQCFDTVKLAKAGEYIIRGHVDFKEGFEGIFVPNNNDSCIVHKENLLLASGIVRVDERGIIPIRIWTFGDGVRLKRGMNLGNLSSCCQISKKYKSVDDAGVRNLTKVCNEDRWKVLKPKFDAQLNQLADAEKNMIIPLLREFADIFSIDKNDIGLSDVVHHEIDTGSERPIACPWRRVPIPLEDKVDEMIHDLVSKGIIRPSESPWNAPLVVVPKKNGDIRLTVDYRKLNAITKRPIFPIPDTRQLLDTLHGSAYFSTLDLSSGFYNVPMHEADIQKTAFSTRKNHWEFVRMPMGLSTSPGTFQKLMHKVFDKENWHQCLIYLDDLLIFSNNLEEQMKRLPQ